MIKYIIEMIMLASFTILMIVATATLLKMFYKSITDVINDARAEKRLRLLEKREEERRREREEYRKGCEGCEGLSTRDLFYCYNCKNHECYRKKE